jgi:putative FmdB family regulatory protein
MPLYEYYCADCRDKFEALRQMDQADVAIQCKNCESMKTSRLLSLFATHSRAVFESGPKKMVQMGGGGCCGGGMCGCAH